MATTKEPAAAAQPPAEQKEQRIIEFVPFGAKEKIQLTIAIVKRLVAVKTKSGKVCSDEDAVKFMLMCQAKHLNPFEGDAFLIGYDTQDGPKFSLITAHQAFLKRAELHNEFDGMDSGTIVMRNGEVIDLVGDWHMPNDNVLGGWATVYFKNRKYPMKKRLRLTRFNKGFGVWKEDPAGMIVKCAEADALRSSFPTMLGGLFIEQEVEPVRAEEVTRAVFEEAPAATAAASNGEPKPTAATPGERQVQGKVVEPTPPAKAPEKKAAAPTLQRKPRNEKTPPPAVAAQAAATTTAAPSDKEKLKTMLAVGNCTPEDFVALAVDEGWLDAEQGQWDKIPEPRFTEFLKAENWALVMELLDERRSKQAAPAAAAPTGDRLL